MPYKDKSKRQQATKAWKNRNPQKVKQYQKKANAKRPNRPGGKYRPWHKPFPEFIGVDGEGWDGKLGYDLNDPFLKLHQYRLLVAGDKTLHNNGEPIDGIHCLRWLASLDPYKTYVAYSFGYDVSQMVHDLICEYPDRGNQMLGRDEYKGINWTKRWISYRGLSIRYIPRKRLELKPSYPDGAKAPKAVIIHDLFTFYQSSFINALEIQNIAQSDAEKEHLLRMKNSRGSFKEQYESGQLSFDEIINYTLLETKLMAKLAESLETNFRNSEMTAYPWEGPGLPAGRTLKKHIDTVGHKEGPPKQVHIHARNAYYGGRFEILAHGTIKGTTYEYDLKSAYPAAMLRLPCLIHSKWVFDKRNPQSELFVGLCRYASGNAQFGMAGPLPIRRNNGSVYYPLTGEGWYWSPEINLLDSTTYELEDVWSLIPQCNCKPFAWVEELYEARQRMEATHKGSGLALKLVLNSLYGKMAQKVGARTHLNYIFSGLITSITRAKLYEVYLAHGPQKVTMFATDAIFLTEPASELTLGSGLGQWELEGPYTDLCQFMPGLYFDDENKVKSRGLSKLVLKDKRKWFRHESDKPALLHPETYVHTKLPLFVGPSLALARNKPWICGEVFTIGKDFRPIPTSKRDTTIKPYLKRIDGIRWSKPYKHGATTVPYADDLLTEESLGIGGDALEAAYDHVWHTED